MSLSTTLPASRRATVAALLAVAAIGVAAPQVASAQYTWSGAAAQSGNWTATARWTGGPAGTYPNTSSATATFNLPLSTAPSGVYNVQISNVAGSAVTTKGITVNNYSGVNDTENLRFGANGNGTLTFQSADGPAFYTENAAATDSTGLTKIAAPTTFASDIVFTQNHAITSNTGTAFTSTNNSPGGVTAPVGVTFTKEGPGNVQFEVAPAGPGTGFQGAVVVNNGAVREEANVFANASSVTVNSGGQFQLGSSTVTNWSLAPGAVLGLSGPGKAAGTANPDGALRFQNNAATASFDNPVSLNGDSAIFVNANLAPVAPAPVTYAHFTLANTVSGNGGLIKTGPGILDLTQANSYGGATTVNAGTLLANNTSGSATSGGPVTVNVGATLGGSGFISGDVTFVGGALAPGNSPGLLTLGNTSFDGASSINYQLDVPNVINGLVNDLTQVNGNLVLDGTLNITALGGFGVGTYRLFNYTGSLTDNGLALGIVPAGFLGLIDTSLPNEVDLVISQVPEPATWVLASVGMVGVAFAARRGRARKVLSA
jgi:autotransporter-associated beta strand protein